MIDKYIDSIQSEFPHIDMSEFKEKTMRAYGAKDYTMEELTNLLLLNATERINAQEPDWTFIASRFYLDNLYRKAEENRGYKAYDDGALGDLIHVMVDKGIFDPELLDKYTEREIEQLGKHIDPSRDKLFTYIGIRTLADRYLAKDHNRGVYELPQERMMIIAMTLMADEADDKVSLVKESYWALSNLYMTVATPTLSNAGKTHGQLSSCFIDTVDDSLRSIYDSNTDQATLSKGGGGMGIYLGKVRPKGSTIKGFKNQSGGVIPWMKQINNTTTSVDQLGQRQGATAVYLDVWHQDILRFLDAKLNNGDERQRTHDIFTGVCIPDVFMEAVEARDNWYLFDPHEIRTKKGYNLEDLFDEEIGNGSFRDKYYELIDDPDIGKTKIPAIDIFKRIMISQLETGTPYMFYRDAVNRANPNKHVGVIYCSNLCTEIMQNMSATVVTKEFTTDGEIIIHKDAGDFVVCNLSSINLGRAVTENVLGRLIPIQMRMLDNVIELNMDRIEVPQAVLTNKKYRAVGLGTFGWHHLLAVKGIKWESEEAIQYADDLYEDIAYLTIKASCDLSREKGAYPMFSGSEWHTGEYFKRRGYESDRWDDLSSQVLTFGVRNGYMMAVAPNSSTSLIAGSTASIDPIFQKEYSEEKRDYKIPVTAPDISADTWWYYKSAYHIDQLWSIRQNAKRQRHIDQAISFNIYVQNDVKAKELLDLHMEAWKNGLKTTYYMRSTSSDIEDCESCSS